MSCQLGAPDPRAVATHTLEARAGRHREADDGEPAQGALFGAAQVQRVSRFGLPAFRLSERSPPIPPTQRHVPSRREVADPICTTETRFPQLQQLSTRQSMARM
jgi:hypothetical protein